MLAPLSVKFAIVGPGFGRGPNARSRPKNGQSGHSGLVGNSGNGYAHPAVRVLTADPRPILRGTRMTTSASATLTLQEMQRLTSDFCRSRKRSAFYRDAAWGPVGILVRRLLDERNAILERRRVKPMRQHDLVAAVTAAALIAAVLAQPA